MAATARAKSSSRTARPKAAPSRREMPPSVRAALERAQDPAIIEIPADDEEPEEGSEPERVPAFAIGGTVYTMLADPPVTIAAKALDIAYLRGGTDQALGFASIYIMREMVGEESYRALLDAKRMTTDQYKAITEKVTIRAYAALDAEDGSPNP